MGMGERPNRRSVDIHELRFQPYGPSLGKTAGHFSLKSARNVPTFSGRDDSGVGEVIQSSRVVMMEMGQDYRRDIPRRIQTYFLQPESGATLMTTSFVKKGSTKADIRARNCGPCLPCQPEIDPPDAPPGKQRLAPARTMCGPGIYQSCGQCRTARRGLGVAPTSCARCLSEWGSLSSSPDSSVPAHRSMPPAQKNEQLFFLKKNEKECACGISN